MVRDVAAGIAYFILIVVLGTILGTVWILLVEPAEGALPSVLLELPIMLGLSWFACGYMVRWWAVAPSDADRLLMGGSAFICLMAAELGLALYPVGGTVAGHFKAYAEPAQLAGLLGQVAFGLFPLVRSRLGEPVIQ